MNNNYYRFSKSVNDNFVNIPVELSFDMGGRTDGIEIFEKDIAQEIINDITDFETTKFSNSSYLQTPDKTDITYEFNFLNPIIQSQVHHQHPEGQGQLRHRWVHTISSFGAWCLS